MPLKPLFEIAPKTQAATSSRCPRLVLPTLAPECRQRAQSGQQLLVLGPAGRDAGNPTSHARAERADTLSAGARAGAADEVPLSGNFSGPGAAGPARCASPEPREPKTLLAATYLTPRGGRGAHPRFGRRSMSCRGASIWRVQVGGAGSAGSTGTFPAAAHTG